MESIHCWTEGSAGASAVTPSQSLGLERKWGEKARTEIESERKREKEERERERGGELGREERGKEEREKGERLSERKREKQERGRERGGERERGGRRGETESEQREWLRAFVAKDQRSGPANLCGGSQAQSHGKGPSALQHLRAPPPPPGCWRCTHTINTSLVLFSSNQGSSV